MYQGCANYCFQDLSFTLTLVTKEKWNIVSLHNFIFIFLSYTNSSEEYIFFLFIGGIYYMDFNCRL